jgi:hypothetical protein
LQQRGFAVVRQLLSIDRVASVKSEVQACIDGFPKSPAIEVRDGVFVLLTLLTKSLTGGRYNNDGAERDSCAPPTTERFCREQCSRAMPIR